MPLTTEQKSTLNKVRRWLKSHRREMSIGGLAGTGKTTIVGAIQRQKWLRSWKVDFLAPTGKAAQMLRSKGIVGAKTIHSFMYRFTGWAYNDSKGVHDPKFKYRAPDSESSLLVIDEASMVNGKVADELRGLNRKILWVGDHGQLPPVGADPGIMRSPTVRLETIHRQVADSPILNLAYSVRSGNHPRTFKSDRDELEVACGSGFCAATLCHALMEEGYEQVIVGLHRTRVTINEAWRFVQERKQLVEVGDRLVCLKNNGNFGLMNGMTFVVKKVHSTRKKGRLIADLYCCDNDRDYPYIPMSTSTFGSLYPELKDLSDDVCAFDYGYAITCHKSQGSEWSSVAVIEDFKSCSWDVRRWRYTAYTRAKERLCVLIGKVQ